MDKSPYPTWTAAEERARRARAVKPEPAPTAQLLTRDVDNLATVATALVRVAFWLLLFRLIDWPALGLFLEELVRLAVQG